MSGWAGFSEDELQKLQQKDSVVKSKRKLRPPSRCRQQDVSIELPPEQRLNKLPSKEPFVALESKGLPTPASRCPPAESNAQQSLPEENTQENRKATVEKQNLVTKELEKQDIERQDKTRLEQLQWEQKIIEESNKHKKALLAKTIAEKSKQTQAEAVKLKRIQKELQALDDMVSHDIGILRGKIEQASWDYNTARKRYEKAETEYVMAKIDLHKKTDVKEQLTEHLCAIIQQNELRKALKLEELMQQLQLQATEEQERQKVGSLEFQGHAKEENGVLENHENVAVDTHQKGRTLPIDQMPEPHQLALLNAEELQLGS